jgi:hypothetical protein
MCIHVNELDYLDYNMGPMQSPILSKNGGGGGLVTSLQTLLLTNKAYLVSSLGCFGISM